MQKEKKRKCFKLIVYSACELITVELWLQILSLGNLYESPCMIIDGSCQDLYKFWAKLYHEQSFLFFYDY